MQAAKILAKSTCIDEVYGNYNLMVYNNAGDEILKGVA
jgi:hypothetical protein